MYDSFVLNNIYHIISLTGTLNKRLSNVLISTIVPVKALSKDILT